MEDKNLNALVETLLQKQKESVDVVRAQTKIDMDGVKEQILNSNKNLNDEVSALKDSLNDVETRIKKDALKGSNMPIRNSIEKILNSEDYKKNVIDNVAPGKSIDFGFNTKLIRNAATIVQPTNFTDGAAPVVLPFRELGVSKDPVRPPMVADLIQWGTTSSNMVDWIERSAKTNGAGGRAEGGTMGQGDVTYDEKSTKVQIRSEYMKVSNESLKDVSFLSGEINSELLSDLNLDVDNQLLNGDGTGSNLKGIMEYAQAFAAGSFATSLVAPNEADVLRVAINQILVAGKMRWYPSAILMHPDDVAKLDVLKIADGRYIDIPYYDGKKQSVVRVPIVMNTGIAVGDFLVADFSRAKAFVRDQLTVRVFNQNEDDAINNRSTVTANIRLAFRIKGQDADAFVKGDFATAITALTKA